MEGGRRWSEERREREREREKGKSCLESRGLSSYLTGWNVWVVMEDDEGDSPLAPCLDHLGHLNRSLVAPVQEMGEDR